MPSSDPKDIFPLNDEFLSNVLNCLSDGIIIVNREGVVIYVNDIYEKITGESRSYILNKPVDETDENALLTTTLKEKHAFRGVIRDLHGYQFMVDTSPIFYEGELIGAITRAYTFDSIISQYNRIKTYKATNTNSIPVYTSTDTPVEDQDHSNSNEDVAKNQIIKLLDTYGRDLNGKKDVAKELGISLATLYNRLKQYDIK